MTVMRNGKIGEYGNVTIDVDEGAHYHGGIIASTKVLSTFLRPGIVVPIINISADDEYGPSIKKLLKYLGVDTSFVTEVKGGGTRVYEVPEYKLLQTGESLQKVEPKPIPFKGFDILTVQSVSALYKHLYGKCVNDMLKRATNAERHVDLNLRPKSLQELRGDEKSREMVIGTLPNIDDLYCTQHELYALAKEFSVENPWKRNFSEKLLTRWAQELCDEYGIDKVVVKDGGFGAFMQKRDGKTIFVSALHLGGKNTIGLGDRLRDGIVIQSYLGLTGLEGLTIGSTLSALQTLRRSQKNLTKESFRETVLNNRNYYPLNGVDADRLIQELSV